MGLGLVRIKYGLRHCPCMGNGSLRHALKVSARGPRCLTNKASLCLESTTSLLQREQQRHTPPLCWGNHKLMGTTMCRREQGLWGRHVI